MANSLTVTGLDAAYGAVKALGNVSLSVKAGETVVLLGTNGNGKSTLMKCIMGLVKPTAGSIAVELDGQRHELVGLPTEEIARLKETEDYQQYPGLGTYTYGFNVKNITDVNQRKAMSLAINRREIIDNMVDNAVKYTPEDGSVTVAMAVSEHEVSVEVTDTGIGISPADQAHVFSAFHRSTNPNALSIPGTGLGLPIAQRIAESHGGTLELTSELGQGSTFRFTLPLRTSREQAG